MPESYVTIGENSKSSHFFIHRVGQRQTIYNYIYNSIDNVIFEYSYITKLGEIDKKKVFILGKALNKMLVACNLKKGPFFLYDKTPLKGKPNGLQMANFTNNSIPHFFTSNKYRFESEQCGI